MALVIFDIDGTLLQTELVTVPAVQRTFAAYGLPVPDAATICSFIGHPVEQYLDWLARQCPSERAADIVAAANRLELESIAAEGRLYPGIREALAQLQAEGHALAVCSNGPDDYVAEVLDAHALRPFFQILLTRGNLYDGKETMVRRILEQIPARPAIVVGDRADDVAAAHANGAFAIVVRYGFSPEEEGQAADAAVASASAIPDTVRALMSGRKP